MQDRYRQLDQNLLRRTAGPYIRVKGDSRACSHVRLNFSDKQTFHPPTQTARDLERMLTHIGAISAPL
jgi:hypothetical protein